MSRQVYKKHRAATFSASFLALSAQPEEEEAPRGAGRGDGAAKQPLTAGEAALLTSPLGSIRSEGCISHMPCLVPSPRLPKVLFPHLEAFSLLSVFPESGWQMTRRI